jgi:hypothetical protein
MTGKDTRSQNPTDHNTQSVLVGLWVEPVVKAELKRLAAQEGLTVSAAGAAFLKQALQHNVDMHYRRLLTPIIEAAIDKRMRQRDSRLAWLLVRVAFDAGQTKSLVTNILGKQSGMTADVLKNILAMSQRAAKETITRQNSWKPLKNGLLRMRRQSTQTSHGSRDNQVFKKQKPHESSSSIYPTPSREGWGKVKRELFGIDGVMNRQQAYQLIDEAEKGTVFSAL